jgi:hypothetical protein
VDRASRGPRDPYGGERRIEGMRRLLPLLLLALIPVPSAALADGCPPSTCGTTSSARPGSNLLFVRPSGQQGPLHAFDLRTGARRFTLPNGVLSADGRTFVSSAPAKATRTTIARFDARTGKLQRGSSVRGRWNVAGVSADGSQDVLARYSRHVTAFRAGGSRYRLRGNYEVEALSPDGRRLFVVHWRRRGYDLQQLDLASRALRPTRLDEPDEKMSGTAVNAIATRDGRWLLTLYAKPDGTAFVHALDLRSGIAHCVDLPLKGDYGSVWSTALALSPDEQQLYLASPLLGRVTTVDMRALDVASVSRFKPVDAMKFTFGIGPSAAISPNGRMLAFVTARRLWLVDTAFGVVRGPKVLRENVLGVGFSSNGRQVVAVTAHGRIAFDAATGERL